MNNITPDEFSGTKGFFASLAKYYSDFLANDFKKTRLPKRRYSLKDRKGKRIGTSLKHFSGFYRIINSALQTKNLASSDISYRTININKGQYTAHLDSLTVKSIKAEINSIKEDDFQDFIKSYIEQITIRVKKEKLDAVLFTESLIESLGLGLKRHIIFNLLERLQPYFEKSPNNPVDKLIEIEDELTETLLAAFEEESSIAVTSLLVDKDDKPLRKLINDKFELSVIKKNLQIYFDTFSVEDLYDNFREMLANSELIDKVEFYLNLGEASYKNNKFPIYFIPLEVEKKQGTISLSISNILYVNKKAIDYISQDIMRKLEKSVPSYVKDRVVYIEDNASIYSMANDLISKIMDSFNLGGTMNFGNQMTPEVKNTEIRVSTNLSISLFDKSDESMMNDYEALLTGLEGGGELKEFFENLISNFLFKNPKDIVEEVDDEWESLSTSNKLIYNSPLPLAEEQRKILEAIEKKEAKYIAVQGPPGTGKSHTITAIAFNAILEEKSLLILSDTKEALDVVENKLNQSLAKVRVDKDFQNPILRLGKTGSNYAQLMKPATIEKIKISYNSTKSEQERVQKKLNDVSKSLEKNINKEIKQVDDFPGENLAKYNFLADTIHEKYKNIKSINIDQIFDIIESDKIDLFNSLFYFFSAFNKNLELNLKGLDVFADSIDGFIKLNEFITYVNSFEDTSFFYQFPKISLLKITKIRKVLRELENEKGIFGYFFAREAIDKATQNIYKITGKNIKNIKSNIPELRNLLIVAEDFFKFLKKYKFTNEQINLLNEFNFTDLKELSKNELIAIDSLSDKKIDKFFKKSIKNIKYLFTDTSETPKLEDLTNDVLEISNLKNELVGYFEKLTETNFLQNKSKIEELNTAKLAHIIDKRLIKFHQDNKATAKTLGKIIRKKGKFPTDSFPVLKTAFPCIIAGLRDYADYIPLEENLFDIIVIDEASQVSIAQALPAIMRSKKMIVLGDREQFSNIKTSTASKDINNSYTKSLREDFNSNFPDPGLEALERINVFNVTNSVMEFFEMISNYNIMLRKHFRSYPEMISFSSKYFYKNNLQPMKILDKPVSDVIVFSEVKAEKLDLIKNINSYECEYIITQLEDLIISDTPPSVAIITPFTDQQTYITKEIYNHPKIDDFKSKLNIRIFTFDTCQGEERDIIFYSMVASYQQDKLIHIFPKSIDKDLIDDQIDGNKRMQRLNVGFSRAKEKIVIVHSKPIEEFTGAIGEALRHYKNVLETSYEMPTEADTDQKSKMEGKLLNWIKQTSILEELRGNFRLKTQFKVGEYLKRIDPHYTNPRYEVDFLLQIKTNEADKYHNIIIEYDGLKEHFTDLENINSGNFEYYMREEDIERQKVLESYGYHMIRVNKFNLGKDEVSTIDKRIRDLISLLNNKGSNELIDELKKKSKLAEEGLKDGTKKLCNKCSKYLDIEKYFRDERLKSKYGIVCKDCKVPREPFYGRRYRRKYY